MLEEWVSRVTAGLVYRHHECRSPIIHRDIKSSNVLLIPTWTPRPPTSALPTSWRELTRPSPWSLVPTAGSISIVVRIINAWTWICMLINLDVCVLMLNWLIETKQSTSTRWMWTRRVAFLQLRSCAGGAAHRGGGLSSLSTTRPMTSSAGLGSGCAATSGWRSCSTRASVVTWTLSGRCYWCCASRCCAWPKYPKDWPTMWDVVTMLGETKPWWKSSSDTIVDKDKSVLRRRPILITYRPPWSKMTQMLAESRHMQTLIPIQQRWIKYRATPGQKEWLHTTFQKQVTKFWQRRNFYMHGGKKTENIWGGTNTNYVTPK
jgi:hypothetical protein